MPVLLQTQDRLSNYTRKNLYNAKPGQPLL